MNTRKINFKNFTISVAFNLFVLLFVAGSCTAQRVKGEGEIIKQNREVNGFKGISSSNGIDVYLTQADTEKVSVETYGNLQSVIKTEVKDGILKIYADGKYKAKENPKVYVSIKTLEKIEAQSGSDIFGKGNIKTKDLRIELSSGSDLKMKTVSEKIDCDMSSGSDMILETKAKNLVFEISSSADVIISGSTNKLSVSASSGSDFKGFDLKSKNCNVDVSSGADVEINVSGSLKADASSGGDIDYKGNPSHTNFNSSSGGDITNKN